MFWDHSFHVWKLHVFKSMAFTLLSSTPCFLVKLETAGLRSFHEYFKTVKKGDNNSILYKNKQKILGENDIFDLILHTKKRVTEVGFWVDSQRNANGWFPGIEGFLSYRNILFYFISAKKLSWLRQRDNLPVGGKPKSDRNSPLAVGLWKVKLKRWI